MVESAAAGQTDLQPVHARYFATGISCVARAERDLGLYGAGTPVVEVRTGSGERVDFATVLPGKDDSGQGAVLLPIDAKFPLKDYQRLVEAGEAGDAAQAAEVLRRPGLWDLFQREYRVVITGPTTRG